MNLLFLDGAQSDLRALVMAGERRVVRRLPTRFDLVARLPGLVEAMLHEAGLELASLDRLAVGIGPGSLTGLRVVLAFVRTLAQLRRLPLLAIDRFAWGAATLAAQGVDGPLRLAVPAFANQFYVQDRQPPTPRPSVLLPDAALTASPLPVWIVAAPALPGCAGSVEPDDRALAELLLEADPKPLLNVLPLYIVPSQAELAFAQRQAPAPQPPPLAPDLAPDPTPAPTQANASAGAAPPPVRPC